MRPRTQPFLPVRSCSYVRLLGGLLAFACAAVAAGVAAAAELPPVPPVPTVAITVPSLPPNPLPVPAPSPAPAPSPPSAPSTPVPLPTIPKLPAPVGSAAQATATESNPLNVIDPKTFRVDPNGTVHLKISRTATTLVLYRIGPLKKYGVVEQDAHGLSVPY